MSDLISCEALLSEFELPDDITDPYEVLMPVMAARALIKTAPAVDAIELGKEYTYKDYDIRHTVIRDDNGVTGEFRFVVERR